jgi:predicted secreted protein
MRLRTMLRLAGSAVVAVTAVTAFGVLAGCGTESSPVAGKTVAVTPSAKTGTSVDANVGDFVVVSLDANATTGYEWQFTAGDTFTIASSRYVPTPAPSNMVGTGGTQIVTLKVTKSGSSDLTGVYRRPWESPSPGAEPDFRMTVVSK